eukprot:TRINITY_DN22496_c0_g1_i1.p1 TRINITY_DN22496_c0_g1~~TRINITY_DN22496_c0_g1_i1.p1  ORF type:complete len:370 (+),score=36.35 TRINITY_DN22496_c0_g1_i1:174-1283(+)
MSWSLPAGWTHAFAPSGAIYFIDHGTRSTTWLDPNTALRFPLPQPWEKQIDPQGCQFFLNHQTRHTSWSDPRLNPPNFLKPPGYQPAGPALALAPPQPFAQPATRGAPTMSRPGPLPSRVSSPPQRPVSPSGSALADPPPSYEAEMASPSSRPGIAPPSAPSPSVTQQPSPSARPPFPPRGPPPPLATPPPAQPARSSVSPVQPSGPSPASDAPPSFEQGLSAPTAPQSAAPAYVPAQAPIAPYVAPVLPPPVVPAYVAPVPSPVPAYVPDKPQLVGWAGEITRPEAESMLNRNPPGTYLTRWSRESYVVSLVNEYGQFGHIGGIRRIGPGDRLEAVSDTGAPLYYDNLVVYCAHLRNLGKISNAAIRS